MAIRLLRFFSVLLCTSVFVATVSAADTGDTKPKLVDTDKFKSVKLYKVPKFTAQVAPQFRNALAIPGLDTNLLNTAAEALGNVVLSAAEEKAINKAGWLVMDTLDKLGEATKADFTSTKSVIEKIGLKKLIVDPSPLIQQLSVDLFKYYASTLSSADKQLVPIVQALSKLALAFAIPAIGSDSGNTMEGYLQTLLEAIGDSINGLGADHPDSPAIVKFQKVINDFMTYKDDTLGYPITDSNGNVVTDKNGKEISTDLLDAFAVALISAYQYKTNQSYSAYLKTVGIVFVAFANSYVNDELLMTHSNDPDKIPALLTSTLSLVFTAFGNNGKGDPTIFINSIADLMQQLIKDAGGSNSRIKKALRVVTVVVDYSRMYALATTSSGGKTATETQDSAKQFLISEASKEVQTTHQQLDAVLAISGYAGLMPPWHVTSLSSIAQGGTPLVLDLGISLQWFLWGAKSEELGSKAGLLFVWSPVQLGQYVQLQSDLTVNNSVDIYSAFNPISFTLAWFWDYPTPLFFAVRLGKYSTQAGGGSPKGELSVLFGISVPLFELWSNP